MKTRLKLLPGFVFALATLATANQSWACMVASCQCSANDGNTCCALQSGPNNLAVTEQAMATLAQSKEFSSADRFQKEIIRIAALPKNKDRLEGYSRLVGITTASERLHFITSKADQRSAYVDVAAITLALDHAQAEQVVAALWTALRGK